MKSILIIPVNYNSYYSLKSYLESIEISLNAVGKSELAVDVVVADNSSEKETIDNSYKYIRKFEVISIDNKGYFGGAFEVYNSIKSIVQYDYVIISNVDLRVDESFFSILASKQLTEEIGWLAPAILSKQENRDMNPKIANRYSKRQMQLLLMMYKYPIIKCIYLKTMHKAKHRDEVVNHDEKDIYAGHGAMFILTKSFVSKNLHLEYPVFLYGEEIYMGEEMRLCGLKTRYIPSLKVYDDAHVSTGTIKRSQNSRYNVEAMTYLLKKYYE